MQDIKIKEFDRKGVILFLALTFGATIAVSLILWSRGVSLTEPSLEGQLVVAGAMFFPGISSLIARRLRGDGLEDAGLKWGQRKFYLQAYFLILAIFVAAYGLTALFLTRPDFSLAAFTQRYGTVPPQNPAQMLLAITITTITIAPIINSVPAFGEELGWRGYLLPRLLPLGKARALIISGIIWGLWHVPFVLLGFHYSEHRVEGTLLFTTIITLFGIYVGYLRLASGSTLLAAFAHGMFNSQFYGVWQLIFPDANPLLGGITGIAGASVLMIVAAWALKICTKRSISG